MSAIDTAERKARAGDANVVPTRAILVEGWGDLAPFEARGEDTVAAGSMASHGVGSPIALGIYVHQLTVDDPAEMAAVLQG